jgi:hypothetical protein
LFFLLLETSMNLSFPFPIKVILSLLLSSRLVGGCQVLYDSSS